MHIFDKNTALHEAAHDHGFWTQSSIIREIPDWFKNNNFLSKYSVKLMPFLINLRGFFDW